MDDDDEPNILSICEAGDLIFEVRNDQEQAIARYRVFIENIVKASAYFRTLVSSEFSDGIRYRSKREALEKKYGKDYIGVPPSELPVLGFMPEGNEPKVIDATKLLLQILHSDIPHVLPEDQRDNFLSRLGGDVDLLAHIAMIADQFDASASITHIVKDVLKGQPKCTVKPRKGDANSARYWRQLLYMAYLHKQPEAFTWISGTMIIHGYEVSKNEDTSPPWMSLPNYIEEELQDRRTGLFNTVASVPNALLKPYMLVDKSKSPICKRGLGSSPACDSFQLGESLRWLCRRKVTLPNLDFDLYAASDEGGVWPQGTPQELIKTLKEFPDYQIDRDHSRCGIKGKLAQILDAMENLVTNVKYVGICLECWMSKRAADLSWSMVRRNVDEAPYTGNLRKDAFWLLLPGKNREDDSGRSSDQGSSSSTSAVVRSPSRHIRGGTPSGCANQAAHTLYAKVFAPEKWTEKVWLVGNDSTSIQDNGFDSPTDRNFSLPSFTPSSTAPRLGSRGPFN